MPVFMHPICPPAMFPERRRAVSWARAAQEQVEICLSAGRRPPTPHRGGVSERAPKVTGLLSRHHLASRCRVGVWRGLVLAWVVLPVLLGMLLFLVLRMLLEKLMLLPFLLPLLLPLLVLLALPVLLLLSLQLRLARVLRMRQALFVDLFVVPVDGAHGNAPPSRSASERLHGRFCRPSPAKEEAPTSKRRPMSLVELGLKP